MREATHGRRKFARRSLLTTSALALLIPSAALAQASPSQSQGPGSSTPVQAQRAPAAVDEVVVTGTRINRDGYDAPTPTLTVGTELLQTRAASTLVDALATLPVFRQVSTPGTASAAVGGTGGQSFVNLRGLGANRTLVLLDGERFVPSTASGTVDISVFPSALVSRIDLVTGGASAAYGSDAVSGVVNVVLDNSYKGLKGNAEGGISDRGDGGNGKVSLTYGTSLAEDRLHVLLSGEVYHTDGVKPLSRPWSAVPGPTLLANPNATATNGQPTRLLLPYVYYGSATFGGLINAGPLKGTQFGPGGQPLPFTYCDYVSSSAMACAGPRDLPYTNAYAYMSTPQTRHSVYGRLGYDISDAAHLYATFAYGDSHTSFLSSPPNTVISGSYTIKADNAFLPSAVKAQMLTLGLASFPLGRTSDDIGASRLGYVNTTDREVVGVTGKFGGSWTYKVYGEFGSNKDEFTIGDNVIKSNIALAIDSVINPATGLPICRSTLTNPSNGCAPLNLFGVGSPSAGAISYVLGTTTAHLNVKQNVAAANISGEPFSDWAGPVSVAGGFEYRHESAKQTVDPISAAGGFALSNPRALNGSLDVTEGYLETVVPLAKGLPLAEEADLNGAVRYTNYSTIGNVVTWKVGLSYRPITDLKIRATRSRDIRAPNLLELYTSSIQQSVFVVDPVNRATVGVQAFTTGNANLKPEKADTWSVGAVYQPSWLRGLAVSLDYYNISIDDAITTVTAQDLVNRCAAGSTALCGFVARDGSGTITSITAPYLNLQKTQTDGVDIQANYRLDLRDLVPSLGGRLDLRAIGNYVDKLQTNDGVTTVDNAGSLVVGQPKWTWDFGAIYSRGPITAGVDVSYIGAGAYNTQFVAPTGINYNSVRSARYVNLSFKYDDVKILGSNASFYAYVSNLFDEAPPPEFGATGGALGAVNYDRIGRAYKLGLKFEY